MQIPERTRFIGDEDELQLWWEVNGALVDFSAGGWSYAATLTPYDGGTAVFTKTNGFTGAAGSGTPASGTPNLRVQFATSGEMNAVTTEGKYRFTIVATKSSSDTTCQVIFRMRARP